MCIVLSVLVYGCAQSVSIDLVAERVDLSVDHLSELFKEGKRVNIHVFGGFVPSTCHQDVESTFEDRLQ